MEVCLYFIQDKNFVCIKSAQCLWHQNGSHVASYVVPAFTDWLMYSGSFALKLLSMLEATREYLDSGGDLSVACRKSILLNILSWVVSTASCMSSWHNYFVAPLREELLVRACIIPLLLCGGFSTCAVISLCPISFRLAHLNHLLELHLPRNCSALNAFQVVGHLTASLVVHMFCNIMGKPVIFFRRSVKKQSPCATEATTYTYFVRMYGCDRLRSHQWNSKKPTAALIRWRLWQHASA